MMIEQLFIIEFDDRRSSIDERDFALSSRVAAEEEEEEFFFATKALHWPRSFSTMNSRMRGKRTRRRR